MRPPADNAIKVLVARLSPESATGLSFTHSLLCDIIASSAGGRAVPDVIFFPEPSEFAAFASGKRRLVSKRLGLSPSEFDVVAVSNSVPLELFNFYHFMKMASIPMTLRERASVPEAPLVIAGGVSTPSMTAVTGDPALSKSAIPEGGYSDDGRSSLVDLIFLGEAEASLPLFIGEVVSCPNWRDDKEKFLSRAADRIKGVYYPPAYRHVFRRAIEKGRTRLILDAIVPSGGGRLVPARSAMVDDIGLLPVSKAVVSDDESNAAAVPVEITRGCASMCSFCKEGYTQKPYRERPPESVIAAARAAVDATGVPCVNLYSYNFNDHSRIHDIVSGIAQSRITPRVKSQRADRALMMPGLIRYLASSGSASPTFAIEGISARIRSYLSKGIGKEEADAFVKAVFESGPRQVKLFFIVTGLEDESDLSEFSDFFAKLMKRRRALAPSASVVISLMPLVNPQKTPLMFAPAPSPETVSRIMKRIASMAAGEKVTARNSMDMEAYALTSFVEAAGRESSCAVAFAALSAGYAYYDGACDRRMAAASAALKDSFFSFERHYSEKDETAVLPADDREYGVKRGFLYRAWLAARGFSPTPACRRDGSVKCQGCGACERLDAVYEMTDPASTDEEFVSRMGERQDQASRMVVRSFVRAGEQTPPYVELHSAAGKNPYRIAENSFSRLGLDADKFIGSCFYSIEVRVQGRAGSPKGPLPGYSNLDFLRECNYILARVRFAGKPLKRPFTEGAMKELFSRLNGPKVSCRVSMDASKGVITAVNSDCLKKHAAAPFIVADAAAANVVALLKIEGDAFGAIEKAFVIEYIKTMEYSVRDHESVCPECGRVMSVALPFDRQADSCMVCRLTLGLVGLDMHEDVF